MPKGLILNVDTTKSEFQNPMVELRQGDGNYQSLYVTVTDNGDPFDLTGWTVSFMGTSAGSHKIIDANVVLDSSVVGAFTYTPTKAWGQDEGEFKNAYFKFVKSDETASGASFRVNVLNAVDLTDEEAKDYISVVDTLIDQVKTDMDSKLADTQKTLTNTQDTANIVQTNVNDLNTNVNELKSQNNNIKTSDNTWTGTNTFKNNIIPLAIELFNYHPYIDFHYNNNEVDYTSRIIEETSGVLSINGVNVSVGTVSGALNGNASSATKLQTKRNINGVGFDGNYDITVDPVVKYINTDTDLFTLSNGFYYFNGVVATNKPAAASNYFTVEVIQAEKNGFMRLIDNNNLSFWTTKNLGYWWNSWHQDADDNTVLHKTGNETVAGNNTFTGNNSFNGVKVLAQSSTVEFPMWYGSSMKATRFGNLVTINYSVSPSQDIPANTTSSQTIPIGFRPSFDVYMAQGGGDTAPVLVRQNGQLNSKGSSIAFAYAYTAVYFTSDAFPTS